MELSGIQNCIWKGSAGRYLDDVDGFFCEVMRFGSEVSVFAWLFWAAFDGTNWTKYAGYLNSLCCETQDIIPFLRTSNVSCRVGSSSTGYRM